MSQENRALTDRFNEEVLRRQNVDALDEILSEDFVEHDPAPGFAGDREGFKAFFRALHTAFGDQEHVIDDQIADGDRVVERWHMTATHIGDWFGVPPTGKRITVSGMDISRVENGRIVEHWTQFDTLSMLEQLGAIPAPAPA